ncbi:CDD2 [Auxenochlorella protothecoides x Auxenochlorella symbiontica]
MFILPISGKPQGSPPPPQKPHIRWTVDDHIFMQEALAQARFALAEEEIPVGCVIVKDGTVRARGSNKTNHSRNGTRHAEFEAIDALIREHGGDAAAVDFPSCSLYVTCEPCIMCAGALSLLRFKDVVFGCPNDKFGGNGSILSVHTSGCGGCGDAGRTGSLYTSRGGLLRDEAILLLQRFYSAGNPNAPKPHRPVKDRSIKLAAALASHSRDNTQDLHC